MNEYIHLLSTGHRNKLMRIASKSGVDLNTAVRNLVQYLETEGSAPCLYGQKPFISVRRVESMIDMLEA